MRSYFVTLEEALRLRHVPAEPVIYGTRTSDYEALLAIISRVSFRFRDPASFQLLTRAERLVYLVGYELDAEVQNGGMHQYLSNSSGDAAQEVREHLMTLGETELCIAFDKLASIFPDGRIPTDRYTRQNVMDAAWDEEDDEDGPFMRLFDDATAVYRRRADALYSALMDFVEANRASFVEPGDEVVRERQKELRKRLK